jgi:methylated-DNA-protein-cysteine methyltransferase related protein
VKPDRAFHRIWVVVAQVPRGRVVTYGQIARMAGLPNGARTVGWAMRALPNNHRVDGRPVPWHRVINAQGGISLRGGEDGGGASRQRAALRREGVRVGLGGRIDLRRYLWRGQRRRA